MELRQLAVVVAVAEEGGFTAAAQRLRTGQSTVSTVVRALERDLGTPLFHRTTHRVVLTPAGEAFVPAARAALQAAERARAAVSPVSGTVRLGVCPGLLADLPRVLAGLRQAHPGVQVEMRQLRPEEVRCGLTESLVDVALTTGDRTPEEGSGVVTLLPPEELVLATASAEPSSVPLVGFPPGWAIRQAVDRAFPDRRGTLEVDDLAAAAGLAGAGLAACVLPASAAARFPELAVRRFGRPPRWQLAAVHRGDSSPAVAALLAQLG
ncbi:LysR family transcriptional regulator [Amycolatopsis vancoresmycina]|uniref:LysR family transcriptional regulator n=1 Tax=Amycolatopsis vancoresmycina DSM 44592 TaxID=1292037 RepID=R1FG58_9PSEU|nr:LysR family transcriptional regulator [Amycolatopsis vancoresmycina]EOD58603.1 LysR family transcriptional regulator [Amycolatopsis vancoresmycina DSM 44592]